MPFTGAASIQNTQVAKWLVENEPAKIQIHGHWAWLGVQGGTYVYGRVPVLVDGSVVDPCDPAEDDSDTASPVRFTFVNYATRLEICMADEDRFHIPNSPEAIELELAKIKLWYAWYARMDTMTGSPATGGLPDIVPSTQKLDLGGGLLTFACLEEAFDLVTANNGRPTMIMSNSASLRSYRNLCWNAGIAPPEWAWKWYDPLRGWQSGYVTCFKGVPWLINDKMNPGAAPADRRIYFMVMGDDGGPGPTRGVTGIRPADLINRPFVRRVTNGVPDFTGENVNMTRNVWLTMPAGLAIGSHGAMSILQNFEQVGECAGGPPA